MYAQIVSAASHRGGKRTQAVQSGSPVLSEMPPASEPLSPADIF